MDCQGSWTVLYFGVELLLLSSVVYCGLCQVLQPSNKIWSPSCSNPATSHLYWPGWKRYSLDTVLGQTAVSQSSGAVCWGEEDVCQIWEARFADSVNSKKCVVLLPHTACYLWLTYEHGSYGMLHSASWELCRFCLDTPKSSNGNIGIVHILRKFTLQTWEIFGVEKTYRNYYDLES